VTINTKDIEAGDIVVLRNGSRIVAYEDDGGIICLMGWPVSAWNNNGHWNADKKSSNLDIIAIEKKPEDGVIVEYAGYSPDFGLDIPEKLLESARYNMHDAAGYVKITLNLTDKTKHKIEEVK